MVKIIGDKKEVEEIVNFIENTIEKHIEELSYHGCYASRNQYTQYDIEIVDNN